MRIPSRIPLAVLGVGLLAAAVAAPLAVQGVSQAGEVVTIVHTIQADNVPEVVYTVQPGESLLLTDVVASPLNQRRFDPMLGSNVLAQIYVAVIRSGGVVVPVTGTTNGNGLLRGGIALEPGDQIQVLAEPSPYGGNSGVGVNVAVCGYIP